MGVLSLPSAGQRYDAQLMHDAVSGATWGLVLPTGGTAHVKKSWQDYIVATDQVWSGIFVTIGRDTQGQRSLTDIAIGPSGSETIIVADIGRDHQESHSFSLFFPVAIPRGTRIAVRWQTSLTSNSCRINIMGVVGGIMEPPARGGKVTTLGADLTNSTGTVVLQHATLVGTKGDWTSFGRCSHAVSLLSVVCQQFSSGFTLSYGLDVGIGTSPQVIIPNLLFSKTSVALGPFTYDRVPVDIPAHTEISLRSYSTELPSSDSRKLAFILHCIA